MPETNRARRNFMSATLARASLAFPEGSTETPQNDIGLVFFSGLSESE